MISQSMESVLREMTSSTVTDAFIVATLAVLFVSLIQASRGKHSQFLEYAPTLMTSLGILGTFTGVVIGLLGFDTHNIAESIPTLLEGLKTAFITSIVGMLAAMTFNALDAWIFAPWRAKGEVKREDVTPSDIHAALVQQLQLLERIAQGTSSQEMGSAVDQLKLLRSDFGEFTKDTRDFNTHFSTKLWRELERFADMMSKSATSQLIEALRQVIQDFNQNLMEQFGENFKALDASVKKLVDWQAEYKVQVEQMTQQYKLGVTAITQTQEAVHGVWQQCKEIPQSMAELKTVLETNQHQIQELQRHLEAFVKMRDAAVEAVPTIQAKVEEIGEHLAAGASQMQQTIEGSARQLQSSAEGVATQLDSSARSVQEKLEYVGGHLLSSAEHIQGKLEHGAQQFSSAVDTASVQLASSSLEVQRRLGEVGLQLVVGSEQIQSRLDEGAGRFEQSIDKVTGQLSTSSAEVQQRLEGVGKTLLDGSQRMQVAMEESAEDFKHSVQHTQAVFTDIANVLRSSSAELSETLKETSTELSNTSRDLLARMQASVAEMQKDITATAKIMEEHSQQVHEQFRRTASEFKASNEAIVQIASQAASRMQDEIKRSAEQALIASRDHMEKSTAGMDAHMRDALAKVGNTINKEMEVFEKAIFREVEKSMNVMGDSLVQITSRFVKDYEQMVKRMEQVIRRHERLEG